MYLDFQAHLLLRLLLWKFSNLSLLRIWWKIRTFWKSDCLITDMQMCLKENPSSHSSKLPLLHHTLFAFLFVDHVWKPCKLYPNSGMGDQMKLPPKILYDRGSLPNVSTKLKIVSWIYLADRIGKYFLLKKTYIYRLGLVIN